jgi:small conductance mechanosensitive channel
LNSEELMQALTSNLDAMLPFLLDRSLNLVSAILILILGFWLAGRVRNWLSSALRRFPNFDSTLRDFFGNMARYAVLTITVLAVLAKFGVETTSLIAVLGAAGLAVGLALQGTLSNVAAGVMLLIFRPFRAEDYVEVGSGLGGTIKSLSLFTTELRTPDNLTIVIPNNEVWSQPIKNYNANPTRRVDIVVGISYSDNIGDAMKALLSEADAHPLVLADPAPMAAVNALGASSVDMLLRVWMKTPDYWTVRFDLTRRVKERLDDEGITIPFPTVTQYNAELIPHQDADQPRTEK